LYEATSAADPEVKKKMDQNGSKTEYMGPQESLALVEEEDG
jgi:hypothetical protein